MFQKWQLWTKLHKFEKTAQLASAGSQSLLAGPPQLNTIWDNSGTKRETATVSTKFEGPREMDRTKERLKDGWPEDGIYSLCLYLPSVTCVTCHTWHVTWPGPQMPNVPITSITHLWEEGGIFWLLKVHLLQIQQVLVSNEGNDECFCWDELACAAQGVNATVKSQKQNLPSEPKLCPLINI